MKSVYERFMKMKEDSELRIKQMDEARAPKAEL